jgi:hypothetical protein
MKARNWAQPYLNPCGREISKIGIYGTHKMCNHLDKLKIEMKKFLDSV